jgi:hypothetical protein
LSEIFIKSVYNALKEELICTASFKVVPLLSDYLILSQPAKSTKLILAVSAALVLKYIVIIPCPLEDLLLTFCYAIFLFSKPILTT